MVEGREEGTNTNKSCPTGVLPWGAADEDRQLSESPKRKNPNALMRNG